MKTRTVIILGMIMLLSVTIPAVYAKGPTGKAGKSNNQRINLFEKTPSGDWPIVKNGAWGKLKYNLKSGKFVFNGHGLEVGEEYTLINFVRDDTEWPATINILDEGKSNRGGNVHIAGNFVGDLAPDTSPGADDSGAKIWLVLSADTTLDPDQIVGWNPERYLFEDTLIELPI
jgi:hypothetical protein